MIAEPPRERYALLPAILIGAALLLVAARGARDERRGALLGLVVGLGVAALALLAALVGKDYVVERNLLPALVPLLVAAGIGFAADGARRLGLLLAVALCAYWVAFDVHVTQTPNLQRPDFRAITDELGPPRVPRAVVTWKLAADPVRFYLQDHALRIYSGETPMREIDVISKSAVGVPEGVPRTFHPVARIRFERLTLTRYMSNRVRKIPFYALRDVRTGFGVNAVVADGQPQGQPMSASEFAYRVGAAARRPASWWQLIKFGLVGGSGYLINLAVFALLSGNLGLHHIAAAIGAFAVAFSSNFFWNRHWTFAAGDGHAGFQVARFFAVSVAALLINLAVLEALVGGTSLGDLPAQAIAVAVAMPFNFLGNKLWTFA